MAEFIEEALQATAKELTEAMKKSGFDFRMRKISPRFSDTKGVYATITRLEGVDLEIFYDCYSGLPEPMFWIGFFLPNAAALNVAIARATAEAKPFTNLTDKDYVFDDDHYRLEEALSSAALSRTIAERYPADMTFYLGRYFADYSVDLAVAYLQALLGKAHALPEGFWEGEVLQRTSNFYERDPAARKACLEEKGYACCVCGLDFESRYGPIGRKYIHVHHTIPLSSRGGGSLTSRGELVPVCPNCHAMLHRFELRSPDRLKAIIAEQESAKTKAL